MGTGHVRKRVVYIFSKKNQSGFSLIELVIAVVLLGILAIFAIPQDSLLTMNLETAMEKVTHDVRYARELAGITNTNCGVNFVANGNYTVYQNSVATPATNPLTRQSFITDIAALFKKVSLQNTVQVEFDPAGKPVLGGGQTIQLTNGTASASLYVTPNTGFILRQ